MRCKIIDWLAFGNKRLLFITNYMIILIKYYHRRNANLRKVSLLLTASFLTRITKNGENQWKNIAHRDLFWQIFQKRLIILV